MMKFRWPGSRNVDSDAVNEALRFLTEQRDAAVLLAEWAYAPLEDFELDVQWWSKTLFVTCSYEGCPFEFKIALPVNLRVLAEETLPHDHGDCYCEPKRDKASRGR